MKKKMLILFALTLVVGVKSNAQSASFTDVNPDPRSQAMGNAGYALDADAFPIFNNTAAIVFNDNRLQAGYSYNYYAPDAKSYKGLHAVGGYYRLDSRHALAAGVRYLPYKSIEAFGPSEDVLGKYSPYEWVAELGYAFKINDVLGIAANLRAITSEIADSKFVEGYKTGNAFAGDLSLMYKNNGWSAAGGVYNIGSKIGYGRNKNDISSHLKTGVAYEWNAGEDHLLTGALQGSYRFTSDEDAQDFFGGLGVEYGYLGKYFVRTGYLLGGSSANYVTLGLGVSIKPVMFNFSYLVGGNEVVLRNSMLCGFSVKL